MKNQFTTSVACNNMNMEICERKVLFASITVHWYIRVCISAYERVLSNHNGMSAIKRIRALPYTHSASTSVCLFAFSPPQHAHYEGKQKFYYLFMARLESQSRHLSQLVTEHAQRHSLTHRYIQTTIHIYKRICKQLEKLLFLVELEFYNVFNPAFIALPQHSLTGVAKSSGKIV